MLALYLALTIAPALLSAGKSSERTPVLVAHAASLAFLVLLLRMKSDDLERPGRWALSLAPLAAIPLLYAELPTLMAGLREGYWDAVVQPWEYAIFGGNTPARTLAPAVFQALGPSWGTAFSEVMFTSYLSYYVIIYLPPVILLARREYGAYERTLAGMMAAFLLCFLVFVVFPVEGPRYIWPAPDGAMQGPIRSFTQLLVNAGSSRGAEFPSSHVAVSVAQALMAWRWNRRLGMAIGLAAAMLSIAVVFAGFHYAIDVVAGAAVGALVGVGASWFEGGRNRAGN